MYLLNAPLVFRGFWKVVSAWIDIDTRQKIHVFGNLKSFLSQAEKDGIPLSSLPENLTGQHQGRALDNTFVVSTT